MFDMDLSLRAKAEMAYLNRQMEERERLQNEEDTIVAASFEVLNEVLDLSPDQVAEIDWSRATYRYSSVEHVRMEFLMEDIRFALRLWPLGTDKVEVQLHIGSTKEVITSLADLGEKIAKHKLPRTSQGKPT